MSRPMKDSGIEWIGQIPDDWNVGRTKNSYSNHKVIAGDNAELYERLALTLNGVIKRSKEDSAGLQPEAFIGYQVLRENELVFKLIDLENVATSRVGLSPYEGIVSPAYIVLSGKKETNMKYGEYYFLSMWQREVFNHMGDDGVRSSLNSGDLLNIPYIMPSRAEQQKIAAFLDEKCASIDAVIEKTKVSIEEYKKLKQAVITQAVTKGIRPNRKMKDSGIEWIGEIPQKWGTPQIKYLAQIASGSTPDRNKPDYWNGTIKWIKTGELQNKIITDSEEYITELALRETSVTLFPKATILVAMYGQGKTRGMTALLAEPCTTNQACAGLIISSKTIIVSFLWKCLIGAYNGIREMAQGTGQPNLNAKLISDFHIPLPPIDEQEEIVNYLDKKIPEINMLITKKEQFLSEVENYKKSLIYEYVTGKKEVI